MNYPLEVGKSPSPGDEGVIESPFPGVEKVSKSPKRVGRSPPPGNVGVGKSPPLGKLDRNATERLSSSYVQSIPSYTTLSSTYMFSITCYHFMFNMYAQCAY